MADITTIKLDTETRDKINKLLGEANIPNQNEMVNKLIDAYELIQTRDKTPELSQDIDELTILLRRIEKIYIGVGERFRTLVNNKDEEYNGLVNEKDSELERINEELKITKEDLESNKNTVLMLNDEINNSKKVFEKYREDSELKYSQLHETYESNKALVEEYKQKNDSMIRFVSEYEGSKDENVKLKEKIGELINRNNALQSQINEYDRNIERIKEQGEYEKKSALLELEMKHQERIGNINNEWESKVNNYLEMINVLQKENRELRNKQ